MIEINKCKLVPGITASWGDITGNILNQADLVSYISEHGGGVAAWGSISGNLSDQTDLMNYMSSFATQSWVSSQGYLTTSSLSGYATESWVSSQGYLVSDDLSQYATRQWVTGRGYITSEALSGYATESWVLSQSYITSQALSGYATESWVSSQNYITTSALSGYATESWVTSQGYLTSQSVKTVNDQSLIGEGNIEIEALTPEQEESLELLTEASPGVLYTIELEPYKAHRVPSGINSHSFYQYMYNLGGDIYCNSQQVLYKWDAKSLVFNQIANMNIYSTDYLWMDDTGRAYLGVSYTLNLATGVATEIDLGEGSNYYVDFGTNHTNLVHGNNGIYIIEYEVAFKFNEELQEFEAITYSNTPEIDVTDALGYHKVYYNGHVLMVYDGQMYELIEGENSIEIVSVQDPYFDVSDHNGDAIDGAYIHRIGSEYLYLINNTHDKLSNGYWVENVIYLDSSQQQIYYTSYGVDYEDYLMGYNSYNYDVLLTTGGSGFQNTSWTDASSFAVDLSSTQSIGGTKTFTGDVRTNSLFVDNVSNNGQDTYFTANKLHLTTGNIDITNQGTVLLNDNRVATTQDCILNRSIDLAGSRFDVDAWYPAGYSRTDYMTTPSGRLFNFEQYSDVMYEFTGSDFVDFYPELPLPGDSRIAYTDTDVYAANYEMGMLYKWDDAHDTWVEVVYTESDNIWTIGSTIRLGSDYKLVNGAWVSDPISGFWYGNRSYVVDGDVYVVNGNNLYQYDESTKEYTQLGACPNATQNWFVFNDELYYTTYQNKVFRVDPDKFGTGNALGVETDIFCDQYEQFYSACQYSDYLYTARTDGAFGHCYNVNETLPVMPSANGTYILQGVKSGSQVTYSWSDSLESRVSTLESNYGDAITTTNNILGV